MKRSGIILFFSIAVFPEVAFAHTVIKGIGSLYNGILHPLVVPAHLIALISLALLLGQRGGGIFERSVMAFTGAMIAGFAIAGLAGEISMEIPLLACAAICGIMVAVSPQAPLRVYWIAGAVFGLMIGLDSMPADLPAKETVFSLIGTVLGGLLVLFYPAKAAGLVQKDWQKIGIRVVGSWISASALMVLALVAFL